MCKPFSPRPALMKVIQFSHHPSRKPCREPALTLCTVTQPIRNMCKHSGYLDTFQKQEVQRCIELQNPEEEFLSSSSSSIIVAGATSAIVLRGHQTSLSTTGPGRPVVVDPGSHPVHRRMERRPAVLHNLSASASESGTFQSIRRCFAYRRKRLPVDRRSLVRHILGSGAGILLHHRIHRLGHD